MSFLASLNPFYDEQPNRRGRGTASPALDLRLEVQDRAAQIDAALAVAGHAMKGTVALDDYRLSLTTDSTVQAVLAAIEASALRQVSAIQNGLGVFPEGL